MATIRDVARRAGVAPASVTRVLSEYPNVSDDLRERVLAAVEEVGYQPDLVAAGLRRGYTKTVGVMINDILNPIVAKWVDIIEEDLRAAGYGVILAHSRGEHANDVANLKLLHQRRVDGLIASFASDQNEELAAILAKVDVPVVLLDRQMNLDSVSSVVSDHDYATRALVTHLIGNGHRRIALFTGQPNGYPSRERVRALQETFAEYGLPVRRDLLISGRGTEAYAAEAIATMLEHPEPPTAVIVGNGNLSALAGALHELRRRGIRIGENMAVAVGEESALASLHSPALTAIERDTVAVGRRAAAMMLNKLATGSSRSHTVVLPTRLVIRESTDWVLS
ncbi:LacI family transcriptional regulator [Microbacterium aerolatum]|uniref:LacI family DNA-binding transcriptional regulator n=1 Tax=Microbacterium aerolatum TaxID=153731 RepID=UPI00384F15BF